MNVAQAAPKAPQSRGLSVLPTSAKTTKRTPPPPSLVAARRKKRLQAFVGLAVIGGATIASALLGKAAMQPATRLWYRTLRKPRWTPPDAAFGLVWPALYAMSGLSAWRLWRSPPSPKRSLALGLWGATIATNALWTPLFFGRKRPEAALVDASGIVGTSVGYAVAASRVDLPAALLMAPYVAWVSFAAALNGEVARHNGAGWFGRARSGIGR